MLKITVIVFCLRICLRLVGCDMYFISVKYDCVCVRADVYGGGGGGVLQMYVDNI